MLVEMFFGIVGLVLLGILLIDLTVKLEILKNEVKDLRNDNSNQKETR